MHSKGTESCFSQLVLLPEFWYISFWGLKDIGSFHFNVTLCTFKCFLAKLITCKQVSFAIISNTVDLRSILQHHVSNKHLLHAKDDAHLNHAIQNIHRLLYEAITNTPQYLWSVESLIKIGKQSEFVSGFQLAFQKKKLTTKNNSKTNHTFSNTA